MVHLNFLETRKLVLNKISSSKFQNTKNNINNDENTRISYTSNKENNTSNFIINSTLNNKNTKAKQINKVDVFVTDEDNLGKGKTPKKHNKKYDFYTSLPKVFLAKTCKLEIEESKKFKIAILVLNGEKNG